ncbi:unnamed protein product [Cyclocybe aegerita]|uniref:Uncharacterized protein n=1 Tax=Cyclocybe aegerita TaxID=1973307 RepID=A0A8S0VX31_CYCAE|nr:unnamed protein product [Cyclocybe aegerita]
MNIHKTVSSFPLRSSRRLSRRIFLSRDVPAPNPTPSSLTAAAEISKTQRLNVIGSSLSTLQLCRPNEDEYGEVVHRIHTGQGHSRRRANVVLSAADKELSDSDVVLKELVLVKGFTSILFTLKEGIHTTYLTSNSGATEPEVPTTSIPMCIP